MQRPISNPAWRGAGAMIAVAESLALSVLVLLGVYVLSDTALVRLEPWQMTLVLCAGLVAYWSVQALGDGRIAFWLTAPAVTLPHFAPAWSHNRIGWHEMLGAGGGAGW